MDDLITPAEAARIRGVTRSAITDLMKRGRLNVVEVGGRSFVQRTEVEKFTPDITGRPRKAASTEKPASEAVIAGNGRPGRKRGKK
jgi:excisionase family DNA binding protein